METATLTKTALFGIGGALVGGLHAVLGGRSTPPPAALKLPLCVPYTHIHLDTELMQTLHAIDPEFTAVDHVAAVRAVLAIDELVGLRMALARKGHEPIMADRVAGLVCFNRAKQAIQRFISQAEVKKMPRRVIYLQRSTQVIMRQLDVHLQAIIMATREIYMHP